ncbi:MAG: DUF1566 domain-containing protein [Rhodoferax sp.]|nr:DUF1566 domain-containing protein [Rhodoferax sp.]
MFTVEVRNSADPAVTSSATLEIFATRYSLVPRSSGGNYAKTECVKDNLTGLVWEGKNPGGSSSRPADGFYTSLLSYLGTGTADDYKNSVNSNGGLCGYMDWRLPAKNELLGIVDKSQASAPKIDSTWFPNTQIDYAYWTSSEITDSSSTYYFNSKPLVVDFRSGNLYYTDPTRVSEAFHVRLVR